MNGLAVWVITWSYGTIGCHLALELTRKLGWKGGRYVIAASCLPMVVAASAIHSHEKMLRGVVALSGLFYAFRAIQTIKEKRFDKEKLWKRMVHCGVSFYDVQVCKTDLDTWPKIIAVMRSAVVDLVLNGSGAALCMLVLINRKQQLGPSASFLVGSIAAGFYALFSLHLFGSTLQLYLAPLNLHPPPLMDNPLSSLTLREFWGRRWNFVIQEILSNYVYLPLRKKLEFGRVSSGFFVFFTSGFIHVWPLYYAGLPLHSSISMMSFFISQYVLILLEDQVGVSSWKNAVLCRLFTLGSIIVPLPLITGPLLHLMDLH